MITQRSTFWILFYLKKGNPKPNGNVPLMCRLTVDGEIKQFSYKMDVPPLLWDIPTGRASGKSIEAQKLNRVPPLFNRNAGRYRKTMMWCGGVRQGVSDERNADRNRSSKPRHHQNEG